MKKILLTLLVLCLSIIPVFTQQIEQVQRTLITKRTATWCPNCGSWGWNLFNGLYDDNQGKAVFLAAHYSGNYQTTVADEITSNFGSFSQPRFFVGRVDQNATSSNVSQVRNSVKAQVNAAYATAPTAGCVFNADYENSSVKVDAKVKFFKEAQGEYYLGIYLIENNVIGYQASIGNNANHKAVLRASFTQSSWGELLTNGTVAINTEFTKSFSLPMANAPGSNHEVVGIIWKKTGSQYDVVNVFSGKIGTTTNLSDLETNADFKVCFLPGGDIAMRLDLDKDFGQASLEVVDLTGRKAARVFEGALSRGEHQFSLERDKLGSSGIYLAIFSAGGSQVSRKIFLP